MLEQPFLQIKMLPRSMTNERLTGVAQIQGTHVVLISCLSPVLNLGLPVTTKNVISPEAAANNPLSLPFHPFFRTIFLTELPEREEVSNERRQ